MADAPPPDRRGQLPALTGLKRLWRRRFQRPFEVLLNYLLLLFAAGASTIYREWLTSPLNALLGWAGGIIFYHQAYWLANIRPFKEVHKCASTLEDAKDWRSGYYFRGVGDDKWWLYMACLGNEDGWSKRRWDGSTIQNFDTTLVLGTAGVTVAICTQHTLQAFTAIYLSEWTLVPLVFSAGAVVNNIVYAVLAFCIDPFVLLLNFAVKSMLEVSLIAIRYINFFPSIFWYGFQFVGLPIFYIFYVQEWIPIRAASIFIERRDRLAAVGRDWEDNRNQQDMEELELIWPWLAGRVKYTCFKLAKIIVQILNLIAIVIDECYFLWIFCGNCWNIPQRVADLTKREVAFELQIDVLERRLATAKESENNYRRKFVRLLGMRMNCINVHHDFNDQDQILRRIRELERQRDDRQVDYHELLAKYTAHRQDSSALILSGGTARTVEKLLDESLHTKDLHRQQIQTFTASLVESGAEITILKDKVKTLEQDLKIVNEGKATLLWRDMEKQYIELRKRAEEEIWQRDVKTQRLRGNRDDNPLTSLSLDSKGQQILRRLREELMKAEDELAHSKMLIAKLKNNEARIDEIKKQIKREALYGASERMGELYMNASIQVNELSEKLKKFEHLTDPEHDIEAVQRNCNEEKGKLLHKIADKTSQISTFKAQIDHAMGCLDWAHNKFEPLDKYLGFVPGAKEEMRSLGIELRRFHFLSEVHQRPEAIEQLRVFEDLARERDRVLDQRQDLRVMCDELLHERLRNETELKVLRGREARRNTQVTNLQTRNTELQVQLLEAQTAVPPASPPDVTKITAPITEIFRTNLLALEMESRRRGTKIQDAIGIPGVDDVPRVEREPGEISMLRIFEGHRERFDELSGLVRAITPTWLGAANDWVDDDSNNSLEYLEARRLNRILKIQDLWDYIGTLNYATILFVREFCTRRLGIVPGVELPGPPPSPSSVTSPTLPSRDRDLFPAQFTHYYSFDIQRWSVFPLSHEKITPSRSVLDALQRSIQAQLPNHYAENIAASAILTQSIRVLGTNVGFTDDPVNERDVAEILYRLNHSFVLKTVKQFPRKNGRFRYFSRQIMYPDTLEVPPPRVVVVLYLSGNRWQGMRLKPETHSTPESEEGSDDEPGDETPLPDLSRSKLVEFNIADWKLGHLRDSWMRPGYATRRENLSSICAVVLSFHWQYPGILPRHFNGAEAYENMYERFIKVYPHADGDYLPLHIREVLEGILGHQNNRPHYRLALINCYEFAAGDVRYFSHNLGGESQSPVLFVFRESNGKLHAMRRRRDGESEDMFADLDWIQDSQEPSPDRSPVHTPAQPVDVVPPADPVPAFMRRDENYGRNVIRAPFDRNGWYFDLNMAHLNEGLTKRHMNWTRNCGLRALYYSMKSQLDIGNLFWARFLQIFEGVFPHHCDAWNGEELARMLKWHPRLGGFTLGIVHGVVFGKDAILIDTWSQPEDYDPENDRIVYVASITDVRFPPVIGRKDHRNHWVGMSYPAGQRAPSPPPLHMTRQFKPPPETPISIFRPLLDAQASVRMNYNDFAPRNNKTAWFDFDTRESFASRTGQIWVPPTPEFLEVTNVVQTETWQSFEATEAAFQQAAANTQRPQQKVRTVMRLQQQPGVNPSIAIFQQDQPVAGNAQEQPYQAGFGTNTVTLEEQLEIARQLRERQGRGDGNEEGRVTQLADPRGERLHGVEKGKGRGRARERVRGEDTAEGGEIGRGRGIGRGRRRGEERERGRGRRRGRGKGDDAVEGAGRGRGRGRARGMEKDGGGGRGGGHDESGQAGWEDEL